MPKITTREPFNIHQQFRDQSTRTRAVLALATRLKLKPADIYRQGADLLIEQFERPEGKRDTRPAT